MPEEQSKYKYIINIEGHSIAYRLSIELSMGSVVLLVDCKNKLWFSSKLKPYIHYVPIKNDLSNLIDQIIWCKDNDEKCKEITKNAKEFYNTYLRKEGIFDYLEQTLWNIKEINGTYTYDNYNRIVQNQKYESENLKNKFQICMKFDKKFMTKNTTIYISKNLKIIKKTSLSNEIEHSAYIGINYINNLDSPNFCYTYGVNENSIYTENIIGMSFNIWIKKCFNIDKYFSIMKQICLALKMAQDKCNFIHFDLYPWNIIIRTEKTIPVIIDYGKSMVKDKNHLILNMVKPHGFHDVLTIMLSSLHDIIKFKKLSEKNIKSLLRFANFIGNTKYTNNTYFRNLRELKEFLYIEKKFDRMLYSNKYELENKKPNDLYKFI